MKNIIEIILVVVIMAVLGTVINGNFQKIRQLNMKMNELIEESRTITLTTLDGHEASYYHINMYPFSITEGYDGRVYDIYVPIYLNKERMEDFLGDSFRARLQAVQSLEED